MRSGASEGINKLLMQKHNHYIVAVIIPFLSRTFFVSKLPVHPRANQFHSNSSANLGAPRKLPKKKFSNELNSNSLDFCVWAGARGMKFVFCGRRIWKIQSDELQFHRAESSGAQYLWCRISIQDEQWVELTCNHWGTAPRRWKFFLS